MISRTLPLLALLFSSLGATPYPALKIIAHRGASAYAPENTLAAFELALEMGADGIELDVHVSADSRLMVIHDPHTGRTANKKLYIATSHSDHLRQLDVGHWKGEHWEGEPIPYLEEALALIPPEKHLFIECKSEDPTAFLNALTPLWEKHRTRLETSTFISFHAPILIALKRERPQLTTLLLIEDTETLETYSALTKNQETPPFSGVGIDEALPVETHWIHAIRAQAQILSVWTVNHPKTAENYKAWGFHFLTTDKPDLLSSNATIQQVPESADTDNEPPTRL